MGESTGRTPPRLGGGRFQIIDQLGDGGTATVYLAWDGQERAWCAVKALQFRHLRDSDIRRRFDQEAEALRTLQHPNIPRLVTHAPEAIPPFMAMELARCGSTMDWVRDHGPMPPALAADVIFQVCEALAAVHAAGMIHRDVKPHNVLLDDLGVCKLTDFGIARVTEATSLTKTGSQIGTFSFMAPEQRTDTKSVDHRADIYSVGASLFTLLTGRTSGELFVGDTDGAILNDVPDAFRGLILRATRYRPEERYKTIQGLQTELMSALSRLSPSTADAPPLVRLEQPLPVGPPAALPPSRRFPDLERSLALDTSQPTFVPADRLDGELLPPRKVIPYFMPTPSPVGRDRRSAREPSSEGRSWGATPAPPPEPDYLSPGELPPLPSLPPAPERPSGTAPTPGPPSLSEQSVPSHVSQASDATSQGTGSAEGVIAPRALRWLAGGIGGATLLMALGFATVIVGAVMVDDRRRDASEAAGVLSEALRVDGNVVYELPGNKASFEAIFQRYVEAPDDGVRLEAALAFVEALEVSVEDSDLAASTPKVRRLREARDGYLRRRSAWADEASGFPGDLAVRLGLVEAPEAAPGG
jgi:serine/threonine protein kinase